MMFRVRGPRASVQLKLFGMAGGVILSLVCFLAVYFPAQQVEAARQNLEHKAATYGRLASRQVEPAIAFDDRQTAREVLDAIVADSDVRGMALLASDGRVLYATGASVAAPSVAPTSVAVVATASAIRCTAPVISKEGPRGTLVLELGTATLAAQRARIQRVALMVGVGALFLGCAAAWLFARSLGQRLGAIAAHTSRVAAGNLAEPPLTDASSDEVGQLARAFNHMVAQIKALMDRLAATMAEEQERLNRLVRERTAELHRRNDDMRLVLDHVGEGFLTIDREGRISRERSAIVETWLGAVAEGETFADLLERTDPIAAGKFRLGFDAVIEDMLPLELTIDQMPRAFHRGATLFEIRYTPILAGDALDKVLLVITDVTARVEREAAEAAQHDLVNVFQRAMRDSDGVRSLFAECGALVGRVERGADGSMAELRRALHTLKGTSGLFGLARFPRLCHDLESCIDEAQGALCGAQLASLGDAWRQLDALLRPLLGEGRTSFALGRADLERVRRAVADARPHIEILDLLASFELEPVERRLTRLAEHARSVADRLGKGALVVNVDAGAVRLDPARWAGFWAATVHVVRNAIDHGIEMPEERALAGKSSAGTLSLRCASQGGDVVLEIADDGRGIDWASVRARAAQRGLPNETQADLEAALCRDDFSTRDEATEWSGRGVGLGAVRAACAELGGTMTILTTRGAGTTFRFRAPAHRAPSARRSSLRPEALVA